MRATATMSHICNSRMKMVFKDQNFHWFSSEVLENNKHKMTWSTTLGSKISLHNPKDTNFRINYELEFSKHGMVALKIGSYIGG